MMREELVASVEELTGRRVVAFLSDQSADPDVAIESFVLAGDAIEGDSQETGA